jgi:hypothetical protein
MATVTYATGELQLELADQILALSVELSADRRTAGTVAVIHLQAPSGVSGGPMTGEEASAFDGFVVPSNHGDVFYPVLSPFLTIVCTGKNAQSMIEPMWQGGETPSVVHASAEPPDGEVDDLETVPMRMRLMAIKTAFATILSSTVLQVANLEKLSAPLRIFVAASKDYAHHAVSYTDAPPTDPRYLEITEYATDASCENTQVGVKVSAHVNREQAQEVVDAFNARTTGATAVLKGE